MATPYPVQNPLSRFNRLFAQAQTVDRAVLPDPNAMSLATVGMSGNPSVRIVLLKDVDERGFVFYTNLEGRKGRELRTHPVAAICFHWPSLEVQVRAEGPVTQVSDEEADAYFASRPRESQIGAWASIQSQPIEHASDLGQPGRRIRDEVRGQGSDSSAVLVGLPTAPVENRILEGETGASARAPSLHAKRRQLDNGNALPLAVPNRSPHAVNFRA